MFQLMERQADHCVCLFVIVLATATLSYTHGILFTRVDLRPSPINCAAAHPSC